MPAVLVALLALVLLGGVGAAPAAAASAAAASVSAAAASTDDGAVPGPVVLVGVPGLRWSDVAPVAQDEDDAPAADTPTLTRLLREAGVGDVAVRSVVSSTCPADGWLAVSSGSRAADPRPGMTPAGVADDGQPQPDEDAPLPRCSPLAEPVDGAVQRWPVYAQAVAEQDYDARLGLLGDTLAQAGVPAASIGPGAAVALAGSDGAVVGEHLERPHDPAGLTDAVARALDGGTRLLVVDAGSVLRTEPAEGTGDAGDTEGLAQVERLDAAVGAVLDGVPDDATVLVASIADATAEGHLGAFAALGTAPGGAAYDPSVVGTRSTRQDGLLQTTDLLPTLVAALGVPAPSGLVGAPVLPVGRPGSAEARREVVTDLAEAALAVRPVVGPFFSGLYGAQVLLYGAALLALRRHWGGPRGRRRVLAWLRRVSVVAACVPVSTFLASLVPWWRSETPGLVLVVDVAGWTAAVTAVAMLGPWRRAVLGPFGAVAAVTSAVLAADVITGSTLQLSSLMGPNPIVAGRFYGLGNPPFALLATGALLLATAAASTLLVRGWRPVAVGVVVVVGLATAVVDGTPGLGSDFGGPPAILPAFALLALMVAGVRITWRRVVAIGGGTLVVVAGLSVLDWLRPADERTHLGRFVETVLHGGFLDVVGRKLSANLGILLGNPQGVVVPVAALFVAFVLLRPVGLGAPALQRAYDRCPALRSGFVAWIVLVVIGFLVNDSGTSIPAVALTVLVPLLIAASVRALEEDEVPGLPGPRQVAASDEVSQHR